MVKRKYSDFNSVTTPDQHPPPPEISTRNLERRAAAIQDDLTRINQTIARLLDAQDQQYHRVNDVEAEKKACKYVAARVGNIMREMNKLKREVATLSKSMDEHEYFQQSTEAQIRDLSSEVARAKHTLEINPDLIKDDNGTLSLTVVAPGSEADSRMQIKEIANEESQKEEEDGDGEERWAQGYGDVIESIESLSRTVIVEENARHKEYARLHEGVAETVGKLDGIDALLHQQRHTQSRIARNAEKNLEDLTQLVNIVKSLQTAVSEQGKSIDILLRNHAQPDARQEPACKKRRVS